MNDFFFQTMALKRALRMNPPDWNGLAREFALQRNAQVADKHLIETTGRALRKKNRNVAWAAAGIALSFIALVVFVWHQGPGESGGGTLAFLGGLLGAALAAGLSSASIEIENRWRRMFREWAQPLADIEGGCEAFVQVAGSRPDLVLARNRPLCLADLFYVNEMLAIEADRALEAKRQDACAAAHSIIPTN